MFASSGRCHRQAFTIVEIIVVISMITLLIALLLPSLKIARREATKALCVTRVRGLGQSSVMFAMDNKLQLPSAILNYNGGNRTPSNINYWGDGELAKLYDSSVNQFMPSGTLALKGYVQDPKLFFCPTFLRANSIDFNWDSPSSTNTVWRAITSGLAGTGSQPYTGYAEHFYVYADNLEVDSLATTNINYNKIGASRLDYVELYWNSRPSWGTRSTASRGWYSPVFYTCSNSDSPTGQPIDKFFNSHIEPGGLREGCNAVFFDGSARWIARAEFYRLGGSNPGIYSGTPPDWLAFRMGLSGSGHRWMRNLATLVKPN